MKHNERIRRYDYDVINVVSTSSFLIFKINKSENGQVVLDSHCIFHFIKEINAKLIPISFPLNDVQEAVLMKSIINN